MEIHRNKNIKFDEFRIYVKSRDNWFTYNIVHSVEAKMVALRHLEELSEDYDVTEYMVLGRSYKDNTDHICDIKTFCKIKEGRKK